MASDCPSVSIRFHPIIVRWFALAYARALNVLQARVGDKAVCTSIVVVAELKFGVAKSGSRGLRTNLDAILSALEILPLKAPADRRYAEIRAHLEAVGKTIGPNDRLIAAHCLAEDLVAVTANADEFGRVPGLKVENWLAT